MNYVFFGTPRFAELVLHELIAAGMPPAAVVCNPDRPVGRRRILTPPQVKQLAERNGIRVLQPEKLDAAFEQDLAALRPDFFSPRDGAVQNSLVSYSSRAAKWLERSSQCPQARHSR